MRHTLISRKYKIGIELDMVQNILTNGGSALDGKNDGVEMDNVKKTREINTTYRNYSEVDCFTFAGSPVLSVLDFWRYCYGNLAGQSPVIAEFLVAKGLGIDKAENVTLWTAYDMSYRGMRIEVKSTEYVHAWNKTRVSNARSFSIAPSNNEYWGSKSERKLSRQNDLYVFCLNTNQAVQRPRPLNLEDWDFYVIETSRINAYTETNGNPNQKQIALGIVKRLAKNAVKWDKLRQHVDEIIDMMQ